MRARVRRRASALQVFTYSASLSSSSLSLSLPLSWVALTQLLYHFYSLNHQLFSIFTEYSVRIFWRILHPHPNLLCTQHPSQLFLSRALSLRSFSPASCSIQTSASNFPTFLSHFHGSLAKLYHFFTLKSRAWSSRRERKRERERKTAIICSIIFRRRARQYFGLLHRKTAIILVRIGPKQTAIPIYLQSSTWTWHSSERLSSSTFEQTTTKQLCHVNAW